MPWSKAGAFLIARQPPLSATLVRSFICALLAPAREPIFACAVLVKLALRLPFSAFPAPLLFGIFASAMGFFIGIEFFHGFAVWLVSLVTLSIVLSHTYLAPIAQSILKATTFVELGPRLPLSTLAALLRF